MNRLMSSLAVLATATLAQGCATTSQPTPRTAPPVSQAASADLLEHASGVASDSACAGPKCVAEVLRVAQRTEVAAEKDAPAVPGHPLGEQVAALFRSAAPATAADQETRLWNPARERPGDRRCWPSSHQSPGG